MIARLLKFGAVALAMLAFLPLMSSEADARLGGGKSWGSRGSRTFTAPPSTATAPGTAPVSRSYTQPGAAGAAGAAATQGSRFGGFGKLLVGGLIGAGIFGLLSGSGLFGGLGSFAGFIGLLLQLALFGGLAYLVWTFFRSRSQPSLAGSTPASGSGPAPSGYNGPEPYAQSTGYNQPAGYGTGGCGTMGGMFGGGASQGQTLQIQQTDYEAFERILIELQTAYGKGDFNRLAEFATPEMLAYFSEDMRENARNGVRNEIGQVKFITGDLNEAWTERNDDYATVSMRYSLTDAMVDVNTGRVVDGDRDRPQEVTEVWTFTRNHADMARGWMVSAIQQVE